MWVTLKLIVAYKAHNGQSHLIHHNIPNQTLTVVIDGLCWACVCLLVHTVSVCMCEIDRENEAPL